MQGDTDIAAVGAMLSDPSRCRVLLALGDGRALSASVLAAEAGVAPSTASEHLGKLLDARLLHVEAHGRHRYYRLAGPEVGRLLEAMAEHAPTTPVRSLRQGTRAHAVRRARCCYDHIGGRLGVAVMDGLLAQGILAGGDGRFHPERAVADRLSAPGRDVDYTVTTDGAMWLTEFGIDLDALAARRRPLIRYCLDWSEQRHHLAGGLGAALAQRMFALGWLEPAPAGRAVTVTDAGAGQLGATFGFDAARLAA
ncbi:MAG TPA: metalloregulator ArsR/SmtB family transcription factor [Solirubrobacteraceae bacterium]|nr:metalloregulator ArsR/SmtB family transcription factor [Solirubrobacteraceae bacterium]